MQVVVDYLASVGFAPNAFSIVTHCPRRTLSPIYEPPSSTGASVPSAVALAGAGAGASGGGVTLAEAGLWPSLTLFLEAIE